MKTIRTITFFINPMAGRGNWVRAKKVIDRYCLSKGYEPEYFFTGDTDKIKLILEEKERQGVPFVFVVGGDGTINELARHMIGRKMALGILPMGSGNGLAGHLGISTRISRSVRLIGQHNSLVINYARINDAAFFTIAGIGFDAEVSQQFSTAPQRGFSGYIQSFFKVIGRYKPIEFTIKTNGNEKKYQAFVLAFANASQYGNSAYIAPMACITDGWCDMVIVRPFSLFATPFLVIRLFTKTLHKSKYVDTVRCHEAMVESPRPGYLHFDGEVGSHNGKIHVKIGDEKLKVLVPLRFQGNTVKIRARENSHMSTA
ncbi:MAG: hypothetical protein GXO83_12065 [Chlorobi bacterium]|nr:hypothetical protein [Chlorobiota bacterium]